MPVVEVLEVMVWDSDPFSNDQCLGVVEIDIAEDVAKVPGGRIYKTWYLQVWNPASFLSSLLNFLSIQKLPGVKSPMDSLEEIVRREQFACGVLLRVRRLLGKPPGLEAYGLLSWQGPAERPKLVL